MTSLAFRASAILWVIWGLVHMFAGVVVMSNDTSAAVAAIADGVDPAALAMDYPAAAGAIINQHGWNLAWIGLTTTICAGFVWGGNLSAIVLAALVGGLADVGYFLFLDLGGFVNFMPGTVMTIVSASAVVLSFGAYYSERRTG